MVYAKGNLQLYVAAIMECQDQQSDLQNPIFTILVAINVFNYK